MLRLLALRTSTPCPASGWSSVKTEPPGPRFTNAHRTLTFCRLNRHLTDTSVDSAFRTS